MYLFIRRCIAIHMYLKVGRDISIRRRLAYGKRWTHPNPKILSTNRFVAAHVKLKVSTLALAAPQRSQSKFMISSLADADCCFYISLEWTRKKNIKICYKEM